MPDKILSLLGLCRRAGKLVFGHDPVCKAMKEQKAVLILTASDFSQNSRKKVEAAALLTNTPLLTLPFKKEELSLSIGHLCGVVAVTDEGFAKKLTALLNESDEQR